MRGHAEITIPEIARVTATRLALGVGLGLLLANRMTRGERRAIGSTLLLCGAFSAGVMAMELFGQPKPISLSFGQSRDELASTGLQERFTERNAVEAR